MRGPWSTPRRPWKRARRCVPLSPSLTPLLTPSLTNDFGALGERSQIPHDTVSLSVVWRHLGASRGLYACRLPGCRQEVYPAVVWLVTILQPMVSGQSDLRDRERPSPDEATSDHQESPPPHQGETTLERSLSLFLFFLFNLAQALFSSASSSHWTPKLVAVFCPRRPWGVPSWGVLQKLDGTGRGTSPAPLKKDLCEGPW